MPERLEFDGRTWVPLDALAESERSAVKEIAELWERIRTRDGREAARLARYEEVAKVARAAAEDKASMSWWADLDHALAALDTKEQR